MNGDSPESQSKLDDLNPMSFAYQPFDKVTLENIEANAIQPEVGEASAPLSPPQQRSETGGVAATSVVLPMAPGVAVSEAARAAAAKAAALAGRLAPMAARVAAGPSAALPILINPSNSESEIIELGDGLRARVNPGQRSVEMERRVDNGLLGTGFLARWEPLPVNAELHVGDDGAPGVLIDHQQLQAMVGPEATARALDAIGSKMARPPKKGEDDTEPRSNTGKKPDEAPNPDDGRRPPSWPGAVATTAELAAKILEQVIRPRFEADVETEIAKECRSVMRARGEQTPNKQYSRKDGYATAIGVRMHPLLPDPTPGRDFYPKDANHLKGYIAEAELANLIQAQGNHFVVHFGNGPGIQGPDVLSIGRDGRFMAWDSKARTAERSVGPSMTASAYLNQQKIRDYVVREIDSGRLPPELGYHALRELEDGNYNVCTVGTANAHNGYLQSVRNHKPSGPRRP